MSGLGKKVADVAFNASKSIDWDGMAKMIVTDKARKEFSSLRRAFDEDVYCLTDLSRLNLYDFILRHCCNGVEAFYRNEVDLAIVLNSKGEGGDAKELQRSSKWIPTIVASNSDKQSGDAQDTLGCSSDPPSSLCPVLTIEIIGKEDSCSTEAECGEDETYISCLNFPRYRRLWSLYKEDD